MAQPHSVSRVSRRQFLATLPMVALAASCRPPYDRSAFALPPRSPVALLPAASYGGDLAGIVFRGLDLFRPAVAGRRVLLKPNLVEYETTTVINTNPALIAAAVEAFRRAGAADVVVAEGPGHRRDIEYLLTATGLYDVLNDLKVRFVDLNHDEVRTVPLGSWFTGLRSMALPVEVLRSDFVVSLPKLKTHHWAGMTAGMKNLFGTVPGAVYGWPKNILHVRGLERSIVDLNATIRPHFAIVDAVVAMEGDGPIMGRPRHLGMIAMGPDLVAVDATCARVMGLDPIKLGYLDSASRFLGNIREDRIDQRGERVDRYRTRFELVPALEHLRAKA
jgi:uncharacterized protein (DUF362 family)